MDKTQFAFLSLCISFCTKINPQFGTKYKPFRLEISIHLMQDLDIGYKAKPRLSRANFSTNGANILYFLWKLGECQLIQLKTVLQNPPTLL